LRIEFQGALHQAGDTSIQDLTPGGYETQKNAKGEDVLVASTRSAGDVLLGNDARSGGTGRWTREIRNTFFDRVYSEDIGFGIPGNGKESDGVAHNWVGRGLKQVTHKVNYLKFATYLADHHPELITARPGKQQATTKVETFMSDTEWAMVEVASNPNARMISALSAAWFWDDKKINAKADGLTFDPSSASEKASFKEVSALVGRKAHEDRWKKYGEIAGEARKGGNPYEPMVAALRRLGINASGKEVEDGHPGYLDRFGLHLTARGAQPIVASLRGAGEEPMRTTLFQTDDDALVNQARTMLSTAKEGAQMIWLGDMPALPPEVVMAQSEVGQSSSVAMGHLYKAGVCYTTSHSADAPTKVYPGSDATTVAREHLKIDTNFDFAKGGYHREDVDMRVVQAPRYGALGAPDPKAHGGMLSYFYEPPKEFTGVDTFIIEVSADGISVQLHYHLVVRLPTEPTYTYDDEGNQVDDFSGCPEPKQYYWLLPSEDKPIGSKDLSAVIEQLGLTIRGVETLAGSAVARASAAGITLDPSAGGHGWYIDYVSVNPAPFFPPPRA
jgi:hypothetical protein